MITPFRIGNARATLLMSGRKKVEKKNMAIINSRERNKAIWRLMRQGAKKEGMVLWVLTISVCYALISNLLTHCSPLPLSANVLDVMASIDETVRNCCYGLIAGISFYLLNDFYKNSYQKVDLCNDMYPDLYVLWLHTYQLVLALNENELDESQNNDELHSSIMTNLCKQSDKEMSCSMKREIPFDIFHILYILWSDIVKEKAKFLEVYGHIIEREEHAKLNDKEIDISVEMIKEFIPDKDYSVAIDHITIRDHTLQHTIYLILNFKTDLAEMVNKYSIYYYGNQETIGKDAF